MTSEAERYHKAQAETMNLEDLNDKIEKIDNVLEKESNFAVRIYLNKALTVYMKEKFQILKERKVS